MIPHTGRSVSWEIVCETLKGVGAPKARSILALIGVAIGTAAVIAMSHVGYDAKLEALRQFETLGVDLVSITFQTGGVVQSQRPGLDTILSLPSAGTDLSDVAAIVQGGFSLPQGGSQPQVVVLGATQDIYSLTKARLVAGRFTSDLDDFAPFAVLGSDIANAVEATHAKPAKVGDTVTIGGQVLTIIGLLAPSEPNTILGLDMNRSVVIPFKAARRMISNPEVTSIAGRLSPGVDDSLSADRTKKYLEQHLRNGSVNVQTARQIIRSLEGQMRIYAVLLLGIGTISMIVGGVGVMNVMLMSVMERRQEIGLRQALGARRKDIRLMFLTEALALSLAGGVIGIAIGFIAGWIFALSADWQFQPAPAAIPLGIGMAIVVGLFFGIYPASRAARLEPIAALRAD